MLPTSRQNVLFCFWAVLSSSSARADCDIFEPKPNIPVSIASEATNYKLEFKVAGQAPRQIEIPRSYQNYNNLRLQKAPGLDTWVALSSRPGKLLLISPRNQIQPVREVTVLSNSGDIHLWRFSPDGKKLFVGLRERHGEFHIIDLTQSTPHSVPLETIPNMMTMPNDFHLFEKDGHDYLIIQKNANERGHIDFMVYDITENEAPRDQTRLRGSVDISFPSLSHVPVMAFDKAGINGGPQFSILTVSESSGKDAPRPKLRGPQKIKTYEAVGAKVLREDVIPEDHMTAAFAPNGARYATGALDGQRIEIKSLYNADVKSVELPFLLKVDDAVEWLSPKRFRILDTKKQNVKGEFDL